LAPGVEFSHLSHEDVLEKDEASHEKRVHRGSESDQGCQMVHFKTKNPIVGKFMGALD
jgi:hypothetical protein